MNRPGAWAAAGLALLAGLSFAQVPAAPAVPASAASAPTPKFSPLLSLVLGRVVDAAIEHTTGDTTLGLFRRLGRSLDAMAAQPEAESGALSRSIGGPAAGEGLGDALVPTLGYAMELLDPTSFAVIRPVTVAGSAGALLRTGEVFVLQFSTNLPGQVRLENIDPEGRLADLGTYTVLVDQLNRIPRDRGIQLQGKPGLERLRFYFYPCMPPEARARPWAAAFARLPACGTMPAVQTAARGDLGVVTPRALINLDQPDATLAFAAARSFQPGDVTLLEARIRHDPPAGSR